MKKAYKRRNPIHSIKGRLSEPWTRHEVISTDTLMEKQGEAFSTVKERGNQRNKCRLDIAVRYLWIDSYLEGKPGDDLYRKMQERRVGPGYGEISEERFKQLLGSYLKNGYDRSSEIELGSDLMPIDGTHRLAIALYFGEKDVPCKIRPYSQKIIYDINWFEKNGFSREEICLIISTMDKLTQKA